MKKLILTAVTALLTHSATFSQDCNMAIKAGEKTTARILTYTNPLSSDPKFLKAKDGVKDEMILAYNASVLSGTVAPSSDSKWILM